MFAVKGWAVSADNLKPESAASSHGPGPSPSQSHDDEANSKKRKRPSAPAGVNSSNVADLWEKVIEGRSGKKAKSGSSSQAEHHSQQQHDESRAVSKKGMNPDGTPRLTLKEKKKLKKLREAGETPGEDQNQGASDHGGSPDTAIAAPISKESGKEPKKDKKKKKKKGKSRDHEDAAVENAEDHQKPVSAPSAPKLTPMQAAMREKLVSARFRHLNETLYTKPSAEAFQLFADTPEMFQEYHEGFRRQVDVWPENPVDGYIADIKLRGRQKPPQKSPRHGGHRHGDAAATASASSTGVAPLLRTNNVCTVADLGCGDAKLASALQSEKKKLKLEVLSYDLQSPSPLVTKADIANLPLADGSVNVVVFCLALMGTNWLDFVEEAYRILHWKGELWVAEIKSRFGQVGGGGGKKGKNAPVSHSVGNRKKGAAGKKGKGKDAEPEEDVGTELAVEVDGAEDRRQETDVSAFVEALRKRGFVLQGEADLRNKMFVKMHFVKAASPTVGKGAVAPKEAGRGGMKRSGIKFVDAEEGQSTVDESSILKPCVYKLR